MLPDDFQQKLQQHYLDSLPGLLEELEQEALRLEKEKLSESYFSIYRQVHSLKGSGGTYGYPIVSLICHQFEDFLSEFDGETVIDRNAMDKILRYIDILQSTCEKMLADDTDYSEIEKRLENEKDLNFQNKLVGLLVDGSKSNAKMISESLSDPNISVSFSNDGMDALQRLLHERFDFLISSMEIPSLNGIALIAATKLGSKTNKKIKTVLLTSNSSIENKQNNVDKIIIKDKNFLKTMAQFVKELRTN